MSDKPTDPHEKGSSESTLKSTGLGIWSVLKHLIILKETLQQLEAERSRTHAQFLKVVEDCAWLKGKLVGLDERFSEVDKRIELSIKLNVKEEIERAKSATRKPGKPKSPSTTTPNPVAELTRVSKSNTPQKQ